MDATSRNKARRARIRAAAAKLLVKKGYTATSMLQVARAALASNETLYRWYDNKQQLFAELVADNAREVADLLAEAVAHGTDPVGKLSRVGPILLGMVTGPLAISLNRAAVADVHDTGALGAAIAAHGRDAVVPALARLMATALDAGELRGAAPEQLAEVYVRLLIGDLQIRRAIGVVGPLDPKFIKARSDEALGYFLKIFGSSPMAPSPRRRGRIRAQPATPAGARRSDRQGKADV